MDRRYAQRIQITFDLGNDGAELVAGLSLERNMRTPCFDALRDRLFMLHLGVQMHHGAEQVAFLDDFGLIFAARTVAVARNRRSDYLLDGHLDRIVQLAVVPHAGEPATWFQDPRRFPQSSLTIANVERATERNHVECMFALSASLPLPLVPTDVLKPGRALDPVFPHGVVRFDSDDLKASSIQHQSQMRDAGTDVANGSGFHSGNREHRIDCPVRIIRTLEAGVGKCRVVPLKFSRFFSN